MQMLEGCDPLRLDRPDGTIVPPQAPSPSPLNPVMSGPGHLSTCVLIASLH